MMRRRGFSLVEILIALGILAVGLVSVFALFGAATMTHRRGVDHTTVGLLSLAALSEAKGALAGDDPPADVTNAKLSGFPESYAYDIEYEPLDDARQEYKVVVTVRWQRGGEPREEKFETVLLRQRKVE